MVCSITAAIKYQVPANIMLAVAEKEGGSTGLENKNRNSNGTYDVGRMQFNTVYLKDLEKIRHYSGGCSTAWLLFI